MHVTEVGHAYSIMSTVNHVPATTRASTAWTVKTRQLSSSQRTDHSRTHNIVVDGFASTVICQCGVCRLMHRLEGRIHRHCASGARCLSFAAAVTRIQHAVVCAGLGPAAMAEQGHRWLSLNTPVHELCLHNTLPTGQSFRWRRTAHDTYTGVIGQRVVQLKQLDNDVVWRTVARGPLAPEQEDAAVMREYFNLDTQLSELSAEWSKRDDRFRRISPCIPGARMLQQDPTGTCDLAAICCCLRTANFTGVLMA